MYKAISSRDCEGCGSNIPVVEIDAPELKNSKIGYFGCPHCEDSTGFVFFAGFDSPDMELFESILDSRMSPVEIMAHRCWFPVLVQKSRKVEK